MPCARDTHTQLRVVATTLQLISVNLVNSREIITEYSFNPAIMTVARR